MIPVRWLHAWAAMVIVAGLALAAQAAQSGTGASGTQAATPAAGTGSGTSQAGTSSFGDSTFQESYIDLGTSGGLGDSSFGRTTRMTQSQNTTPVNLPGVLGVVPTRFARDAKDMRAAASGGIGGKTPAALSDPGEVKRLLEGTESPDESKRKAARERLAELGETAADPLVDMLRDAAVPKERRSTAAEALLAVGRPATAPVLRALADEDPFVRTLAAQVLGAVGDRTSVRPLMKALADTDAGVRAKVVWALGLMGDPGAAAALAEIMRRDPSLDVRVTATTSLGRTGCRAAVEPLIEGLQGEPARLREASARAIGGMGKVLAAGVRGEICRGKAGDALMAALSDKDTAVRVAVIDGLGALKEPRAVDLLAPLATDPQAGPPAIRAISLIGTNRARRVLEKLAGAGPGDTVGAVAREALGQMRERS
jgi:HEAT repeat protein